jgi:uncharacterized protein (DUF1697 family)
MARTNVTQQQQDEALLQRFGSHKDMWLYSLEEYARIKRVMASHD